MSETETRDAAERVRALLNLREEQANTGGRGLVDDDGYVCVRADDVRAMLPPVLTPAVPLGEAEDEEAVLRQRMADLLTRTANALKGDPGPLRSWSWHDLPEVAADLDAARAEVARLREAVERLCNQAEANPTGWGGPMVVSFARSVRAALAPVSSSGEAESGEDSALAEDYRRNEGAPMSPERRARLMAYRPAPVSSGGQADGEGVRLRPDEIERLDFNYQVGDGRWLYNEVEHIVAARLAARPVLSREALRERVVAHGMSCRCASNVFRSSSDLADHLADVLDGEQEP